MLHRTQLTLAALLGVFALAQAARAQDASIQRAPAPPVIDGIGNDAVWNNPNVTVHGLDEFFVDTGALDPADMDITWKALWDDDNIYVLVEVFDDVIITNDSNDWQDDSIEFYFDAQDTNITDYTPGGNPGTPAYQITGLAGITPELASMEPFNKALTTSMFTHGTNSYAEGDPDVSHYPEGADQSTSIITGDNNWTLEVAFPWSALFETPANIQQRQADTGLGMGFGLAYNDDDDGDGRDQQPMWGTNNFDLWNNATNMPNVFLEGSPSDPIQLQVNTETGDVSLHNPNPEEIILSKELDGYTISSESGSLNPAEWNSLDAQGRDGAQGDPFGESWDEVNATSNRLTELFLAGESSLGPLETVSLGNIFGGGGGGDLTADFNGDGTVDGADLTDADDGWEDRFGSGEANELDGNDFLAWQREFGETGGGGGGGSVEDLVFEYTDQGITLVGSVSYSGAANQAAVPEPATCLLLVAGMGLLLGARRKLPTACLLALIATSLIAASPAGAALQHQYTFNDGTANDSVGTADGTVVDPSSIGSTLFGQLDLSANNGATSADDPFVGAYVDLPNGIISSQGSVISVEAWATVQEQRNWARLFDFGTSNGGEDTSTGGDMTFYATLQPQSGLGGNPVNIEIADGSFDPRFAANVNDGTTTTSAGVKHHYVMTWDGSTFGGETASLFLDGNLIATTPLDFGISPDLLIDNNNWIGRSQYGDSLFDGLVDELRIYDHALSAQEVADNFTAGPTAFDGPNPSVTLDRDTREVVIHNDGTQALEIKSYSLTSAFGALDASGWTLILDESTSTANEDLSEQKTAGVGSVAANGSANLGAVWIPSPTEDLSLSVTLGDDTVWTTSLEVVGNGGSSFARSDLDFDGSVDVDDYSIFTSGMFDDLSSLSGAEQYGQGDLNNDGVNNLADYNLFKSDFIAAQGEAAFAALASAVPEPSTMVLLALGGLALLRRRRGR